MWPPLVLPISHVGGGKLMSEDSGFSVRLPEPYFGNIRELDSDSIYAAVLPIVPFEFSNRGDAFFFELGDRLPKTRSLTLSELTQQLTEHGWQEVDMRLNCGVVFRKDQERDVNWIVTWSPGLGLYFVSPNRSDLEQIHRMLIHSIQVNREVCQWR